MGLPKKIWGVVRDALPPALSLRLQTLKALGYLPNLKHPRTFNEHIQARKLAPRDPLLPILADKVAVKDWVAERIGAEYVIPTLWSGKALPDTPPAQAPFVVKANHASGWNRFVHDLSDVEWPALQKEAAGWMRKDWHPYLHEWWYNVMDRKILIEPVIGDDPTDYKFFCFGGVVHAIQVDVGRFTQHRRAFYSRDWTYQPFGLFYPRMEETIPAPAHLDRMIALAETLSPGFDFVRVDFYDLPAGPLFGEMTFAPGAGYERFDPPRYDRAFGDLWTAAAKARTATSSPTAR